MWCPPQRFSNFHSITSISILFALFFRMYVCVSFVKNAFLASCVISNKYIPKLTCTKCCCCLLLPLSFCHLAISPASAGECSSFFLSSYLALHRVRAYPTPNISISSKLFIAFSLNFKTLFVCVCVIRFRIARCCYSMDANSSSRAGQIVAFLVNWFVCVWVCISDVRLHHSLLIIFKINFFFVSILNCIDYWLLEWCCCLLFC